MLNGMNIETGVDLDLLVKTGRFIADVLHRQPGSKANIALSRRTTVSD